MGKYRGCEPRPRVFWNSVRLALKQQVRDLANQSKEKALENCSREDGDEVGCPGTE